MPVCRLIFTPTAPHCGHTVCTAREQWILLARVSTARTEWRTPQCRSISAAAKAAPRKLTSRRMSSCSSVRHLIRAPFRRVSCPSIARHRARAAPLRRITTRPPARTPAVSMSQAPCHQTPPRARARPRTRARGGLVPRPRNDVEMSAMNLHPDQPVLPSQAPSQHCSPP